MRISLVVIGFLCLAGSVQAELWVEIDDGVDLGEGLYSYDVRLVAGQEDDKARAWDGSFNGPMNQIFPWGVVPTPSLTNASYLSDYERAMDTHFLQYDANLMSIESPNESGTHLAGAMAFKSEITAMDFSLAQIVVASGQTVTMTGQVADGLGTKFTTQATIIGGEGAFSCSYPSANDQQSGGGEVEVGDEITLRGSFADDDNLVCIVSRLHNVGPYNWLAATIVMTSHDPNFTFVPTEPGEYDVWVGRDVDGGDNFSTGLGFTVIPEPATLGLLAIGAFALVRRRRR